MMSLLFSPDHSHSVSPSHTISNGSEAIDHASVTRGRVFASVMSSFSMAGALLIIFSYLLFKDIRTKARQVLFHLSIADFGVGCTNLVGAVVYYFHFIHECEDGKHLLLPCTAYKELCKTQAFFAAFFTIASILWTLVLALYVYILVVDTGRKLSDWIVRVGYVVCWGMALLVSLWFVLTHKLGTTNLGSGGWCSLRVENKLGNVNVFIVLFGSDLWVLITFVVILVLYTSTHCYLKMKINDMHRLYNITSFQTNIHFSDHKFLAIPFFFLLLRSGSVVFSILFVYTDVYSEMSGPLHKIIYYWMAIGDSSEGIVNGIIFCLLTPRVRQKLCHCRCCTKQPPSKLTETSEQRRLLENVDVSLKYSTNRNSSSHITYSSSSSSVSGSDNED